MRQVAVGQVDEVRADMPLQVVDLHHRHVERQGQPLGKRDAHEQRAEQAGTAREGDTVQVGHADARLADRPVDYRNDILLVRARGQLGDYASVLPVNFLTGNDVRQQPSAPDHGGRRIVARGFDSQDRYVHFGFIICPIFTKLVPSRRHGRFRNSVPEALRVLCLGRCDRWAKL